MKELSFKVAAKTARLFGRENVSNAEGAISELVKNTYDADATMCLVCFIPRFSSAPNKLKKSEFDRLRAIHPEIEEFYAQQSEGYERRDAAYNLNVGVVDKLASGLLDLWLIDNGDGMTAKTIGWLLAPTTKSKMRRPMVAGPGQVPKELADLHSIVWGLSVSCSLAQPQVKPSAIWNGSSIGMTSTLPTRR